MTHSRKNCTFVWFNSWRETRISDQQNSQNLLSTVLNLIPQYNERVKKILGQEKGRENIYIEKPTQNPNRRDQNNNVENNTDNHFRHPANDILFMYIRDLKPKKQINTEKPGTVQMISEGKEKKRKEWISVISLLFREKKIKNLDSGFENFTPNCRSNPSKTEGKKENTNPRQKCNRTTQLYLKTHLNNTHMIAP